VGCKYSVPRPDLHVRDSSVVPAWPSGVPPRERLPGPRGRFAEPSLSGRHSPLHRSAAPAPLKVGQAQSGQGSVGVGPAPFEGGRTCWSQGVTPINAPHTLSSSARNDSTSSRYPSPEGRADHGPLTDSIRARGAHHETPRIVWGSFHGLRRTRSRPIGCRERGGLDLVKLHAVLARS